MKTIDLNCDVGEGLDQEKLIMPFISSCNIACGGHFGDASTIDASLKLASANQVKIGAHPSFPDRENFGRKALNMTAQDFEQSIQEQLTLFCSRLDQFNQPLHHIKPHGALYNLIAVDETIANLFLKAVKPYTDTGVLLYVPFHSAIQKAAVKKKLGIVYEAFADRNYNDNLTLVSRSSKKAMISKPSEVFEHLKRMIQNEEVLTVNGKLVPITAATYCLHGDQPATLQILKYLKTQLGYCDIQIQ